MLQRMAHGTRYLAFAELLCLVIFFNASVVTIAWACLIILVISLAMMLSQIFGLVDDSQAGASS